MSTSSFRDRVLTIVSSIPAGRVLSYGAVARRAGNANAARAVGAIMRANRNPNVPCHRVIAADGSLGGFNRGRAEKRRRLRTEGVTVRGNRVVSVDC